MAIEKVKAYFAQFGMQDRVIEFAESSATVELAAHAAGVEPGRIAKSLSFKVDDAPILIPAGYAVLQRELDDHGFIIRESYLDTERQPISSTAQYASYTCERDEKGNALVKAAYPLM